MIYMRKAGPKDLLSIMKIIEEARTFLADSFIPQINFRFFLHFIGECLSKPVNRLA